VVNDIINEMQHNPRFPFPVADLQVGCLSALQPCKRGTTYLEFDGHSHYLPYLHLGVISEVLLVTSEIHGVMDTSDCPQYFLLKFQFGDTGGNMRGPGI
jgi:hypothetical protein